MSPSKTFFGPQPTLQDSALQEDLHLVCLWVYRCVHARLYSVCMLAWVHPRHSIHISWVPLSILNTVLAPGIQWGINTALLSRTLRTMANKTTIITCSVRVVLEVGRGLRKHQGAVTRCQGKLSGRDHAWSFPSAVREQSLEAESMA